MTYEALLNRFIADSRAKVRAAQMKIAIPLVTLVTLVAFLALETVAFAQPSPENLYTEGKAAYDRTDYKTAVTKWQSAYDLSNASALLFNLAQAKRLSGDCVGAIVTYRRFVTDAPDATSEQHKLAKDLVLELEGTCPVQKPAVLSPPKVVETPTFVGHLTKHASERPWKIAGLVTGGIGVATLAVGLSLGYHGASIGDEITAACRTNCDWATLKDKEARGKREVAIGRALNVASVAAIAGGAIVYYLGVRQETLAIAPASSGSGGVISWSGSW